MKVNNAQICLDCDELFVADFCPKCMSRHSHQLRKWLEPLRPIIGGRNGDNYQISTQPMAGDRVDRGPWPDWPADTIDNTDGQHEAPKANIVSIGDCGRRPAGS